MGSRYARGDAQPDDRQMARTRRPEYRRFLARLRAARLAIGLTQVEVARRLGRPQSFVSKSETGERRLDIVELASLARLYRKPLSYFSDRRMKKGRDR